MAGILCRAINFAQGCNTLTTWGQLVAICIDGPGNVITRNWWRVTGGNWQKDAFAVIRPPNTYRYWYFNSTGTLLRSQVLGIEATDQTDFLTPAYYVRANGE